MAISNYAATQVRKVLILGSAGGLAGRIGLHLLRQNNKLLVDVAGRSIFQKIINKNSNFEYDVIVDAALSSELTINSAIQNHLFEDELSRISMATTLLNKHGLYIYMSSNSVYQTHCNSVITEATQVNEGNVYAAVKLAGEQCIRSSMGNFIILRLPGLVSKGSRSNFAASVFKNLGNGDEIQIYSPESKTSNYLCATQLSRVIQLVVNQPHTIPAERILNLYTWPPISRRKFVVMVEKLMRIRHDRIVLGNEDILDNIIYSNYHEAIQDIVSQDNFFGNVLNDLTEI